MKQTQALMLSLCAIAATTTHAETSLQHWRLTLSLGQGFATEADEVSGLKVLDDAIDGASTGFSGSFEGYYEFNSWLGAGVLAHSYVGTGSGTDTEYGMNVDISKANDFIGPAVRLQLWNDSRTWGFYGKCGLGQATQELTVKVAAVDASTGTTTNTESTTKSSAFGTLGAIGGEWKPFQHVSFGTELRAINADASRTTSDGSSKDFRIGSLSLLLNTSVLF